MYHSPFSIKNLLHLLGVLCVFLFSLFGFLYLLRGNEVVSFMLAMVLVVIFLFLVPMMAKFKASPSQSLISPQEGLLIAIYLIFLVISAWPMLHFINIEYSLKQKIRAHGLEKVEALRQLPVVYHNKVTELAANKAVTIKDLTRAADNGNTNARKTLNEEYSIFSNVSDDERNRQINNYIETFKSGLTQDVNYSFVDSNYVAQARSVFNNWERLNINATFYDLDKTLNDKRTYLTEKLPEFSYSLPPALDTPLDVFNWRTVSVVSFGILMIVHFLVLVPYWSASRPPKDKYNVNISIAGRKL